jgi:hypothetical protein
MNRLTSAVAILLVAAFASACGAQPAAPATGAGATPSQAGSGHTIHVKLYVPLASKDALGTSCDAVALAPTGPISATIPGSTLTFLDMAALAAIRAQETPLAPPTPPGEAATGAAPTAVPTAVPTSAGATEIPAELRMAIVGEQVVPPSGTVAAPITDDAKFPTACLFTFDVATTKDLERYGVLLGKVYFPVPLVSGSQLAAADWVCTIGVNPQ